MKEVIEKMPTEIRSGEMDKRDLQFNAIWRRIHVRGNAKKTCEVSETSDGRILFSMSDGRARISMMMDHDEVSGLVMALLKYLMGA